MKPKSCVPSSNLIQNNFLVKKTNKKNNSQWEDTLSSSSF